MILAAGLGTRLLPHTLVRPKPLFPVLNQPLLLLTIKRLQKIGFDRIVVNCHHLREQIVAALDGLTGVIVQEEDSILGTGGGLRTALNYLDDEPLLVTNGDIYHTIDFNDFYQFHVANGAPVTLAMHDYNRFNSVMIKSEKVVSFDNRNESSLLAFTGIHMIDPEILTEIKQNSYSCIIDHYRKLLDDNVTISCYRADDCFWTDMGSPADYLHLHEGLLKNDIPCWPEVGPVRKPYCIDKKARLRTKAELADWACIGEAYIAGGSHLERVVVWDGVSIPAGSWLVDEIVSGYENY